MVLNGGSNVSPISSASNFFAAIKNSFFARPHPAARPSSRRSPLKTVHWTVLSAFGGRGSLPKHPAQNPRQQPPAMHIGMGAVAPFIAHVIARARNLLLVGIGIGPLQGGDHLLIG